MMVLVVGGVREKLVGRQGANITNLQLLTSITILDAAGSTDDAGRFPTELALKLLE